MVGSGSTTVLLLLAVANLPSSIALGAAGLRVGRIRSPLPKVRTRCLCLDKDSADAGEQRSADEEESMLLFPSDKRDSDIVSNQAIFFANKDDDVIQRKGFSLRRFVFFNALAVVLALGANFVGITSLLLTQTQPEVFRSAGLDELYPIGGLSKYVDREDAYSFVYPYNWVKDRYLILAEARNRELPLQLRDRKTRLLPDAAFGPPNGKGLDNVSVVKNRLMPGFTLKGTLGEPRVAAERLLSESIAPAQSGKTASLIDAFEVQGENGRSATYVFEFTVQKGEDFFQHSIAAVASRGEELFTLTYVSPERSWTSVEPVAKEVARSFTVLENAP